MEELIAVLESLPHRNELAVRSRRTAEVRKCAEEMLGLCKLQQGNEMISKFASEITSLLKSIIPTDSKLDRKKRRVMWTCYSRIRAERLPFLWAQFLGSETEIDPLFMSIVNDAMFEMMIHRLCEDHCSVRDSNECQLEAEMTEDELKIIRYACGYVGMKLHNRFLKQHGEKAARYVECIYQMYANGPNSSLLEYTREWVERINRGGLFDVSDEAFMLFLAIEEAMRERLVRHLKKSIVQSAQKSEEDKAAIITCVVNDCDVQYRWGVLADNIIGEERESLELLEHIVSLWLTIRGFSITKTWMEDYKQISMTNTKKKKSLRKEMMKTSSISPED